MSITVNIIYSGRGGSARAFADEMTASGTVAAIRTEEGNEAYEYYVPLDDPESVLLIDRWRDQDALDAHHESPLMSKIAELRDKDDRHMQVRRYADLDEAEGDAKYIRS